MHYGEQDIPKSEIAKEIGVNQSTISRELNRNITYVRT